MLTAERHRAWTFELWLWRKEDEAATDSWRGYKTFIFFKSRNKKKWSMWFHKKLLAGKFSLSGNLWIQQSLQSEVFLLSANVRAGDNWVSDGRVCRGIILPCRYGCMHNTFVFAFTECWRLDGSRGKGCLVFQESESWVGLMFHWLCVISPSRFLRHINNQKTAEPLVVLTEMQFLPAKFQLAQAFWCSMLVSNCR